MAGSSKSFTARDGDDDPNGEWTVVLPRTSKRRNLPVVRAAEEPNKPWVPTDLEFNLDRESKLMGKMEACMKKVESSLFYRIILEQMRAPEIFNHFQRVLGSELKMQMVIYGIGSIETYENPRAQLSLAILLKRRFGWVGEIDVFDPILSVTECRVLEALGCSVLSVNEQGRRRATKPTLFYMPHCEAALYNNLLSENWEVELLNHVVLFGNSFEAYRQSASLFKNSFVAQKAKHMLAVRKFTKEYAIKVFSDSYFNAFYDSSWHFFSPDLGTELQLVEI